ncbi:hypothetical protein A5699_27820 [Mycobacterium sp. E802]|nr:hypothetical protein A5699_27820 [Mycobacterium sp. E802]
MRWRYRSAWQLPVQLRPQQVRTFAQRGRTAMCRLASKAPDGAGMTTARVGTVADTATVTVTTTETA